MVNQPGPDCLCIPTKLTKQVLEYIYDRHAYGGIYRTFDRLRGSVYIPRMRKVIQEYIDGCPACQLSKPSRQLLYSQLRPVEAVPEPLYDLSIDFIVGLPLTPDNYNALMTVTDKFSKYVRLIPGNKKDSAETWAEYYFNCVYRFWGIPYRIISDRDPKFTSAFWKTLFIKCGVALGLITAYYPSSDS